MKILKIPNFDWHPIQNISNHISIKVVVEVIQLTWVQPIV